LVKKKNIKKVQKESVQKRSFDYESSPYFIPIAFLLIFIALVFLFSDFLFSDKMLYSSDQIQAGIFFRQLMVDYVNDNWAVPQWNPYIFGGMPYVEAFHGDIFYPLSFLKYFGPLHRMLGIIMFLHIFLAGIFMYLAGRQLKLSKIASLISASCYMFAAYLISLVAPGHDGKIFVTALFPLVILYLDRGFERKPFLNFTILGLIIGVIILSPHPQMSYFTLWVVGLFTIYKLIILWKNEGKFGLLVKPGVLVVYAVVIGLLLSAIQFYPGYLYTSEYSPRADSKKGWDWAISWSMHEEETMSLIVPEFPGTNAQDTNTIYWGKNVFKDNSEAVGAVTFFLALLALVFVRRKIVYFFGGIAILALLYALGGTTPIFKLFYYLVPKVSSLRAPSMIMFIFSFSAALLAGIGIQNLIDSNKEKEGLSPKFKYLLFGLPGLLLLMGLLFSVAGRGMMNMWCSIFYGEASSTVIQQGFTKLDAAYRNLPSITSGIWMAFLFVTLAALCIWLYKSKKMGAGILVALAFIPVIDGVRFNSRFISTYDQKQTWQPNPVTDFFTQKQNEYFRVFNFQVLPADLLPYHKIPVVVGYHGNQLRWYDDLLGGPSVKNQGNPRFLNLVGAKYMLLPANQKLPDNYLGSMPATVVSSLGGVQIIQNDNSFPRAYIADEYKVFNDRQDIYPEVIEGTDSLRNIVYLEEEPGMEIVPDTLNNDSAWIEHYSEDTVIVGVNVTGNRLLVLTDNYYEAWQVTIDGHDAKPLRAYGSFRAVAIPDGANEVSFVYKSQRYRTGKLVTWLTTLYLLFIFGFYGIKTLRDRNKLKETS